MEAESGHSQRGSVGLWVALVLCVAVVLGRAAESLARNQPAYARSFAPDWLPLVAILLVAAGIVCARLDGRPLLTRLQGPLTWGGLLLMVWVANGLPFDLLRAVGLIPLEVDWPGLATRTLALAAAVALLRLALAGPAAPVASRWASLYGYAAFVLALPYPALRTHWALGGTLGLASPGAAGEGFAPLLLAIPWLLAAALSLLLASPRRWMPRRLLLVAGWSATAIVAAIGPAAFWSFVTMLASGGAEPGPVDIATWVFGLFYGSWFLWAIAAGFATLSYQMRGALPKVPAEA